MPSCAPLAVPYVPFQQQGSQKYSQADALANGTLFQSACKTSCTVANQKCENKK